MDQLLQLGWAPQRKVPVKADARGVHSPGRRPRFEAAASLGTNAMGSIIGWVRGTGGWARSPYGDLPALRPDDTAMHQTWLILAGGIALVLSRASKAELQTRFAATRQVYAIARSRLRKRRLPKPEPSLLQDALQEIANLADPMTREAGRECLDRCIERLVAKTRLAAGARASSAGSSLHTSHGASTQGASTQAASTQAASTQVASIAAADEHEATQLDLDLLFERSNKLRGTVAWARSTTFGPDA